MVLLGLALLVGSTTVAAEEEPLPAIDPDPTPKLAEFQPYVRTLEKLDAYARCSKPILVDPKGPTLAVATHRVGNAVDNTTFGRLYLTRKDDNAAQLVLDIEATILLFDHHIDSGRSLAALGVNSPSERGGDLVLLAYLADGNPEAIARWHLPNWNRPGFKPKVEFARLLDANRAIVQVNDKIYLWNVAKGTQQLQIDGLQAGAKLDLSGTGQYLALPTGGGCRIVDLVKGELLGMAPFTTNRLPEVRFSPDGKRLAMVGGNQFVVWDLTKAKVASQATLGISCEKHVVQLMNVNGMNHGIHVFAFFTSYFALSTLFFRPASAIATAPHPLNRCLSLGVT